MNHYKSTTLLIVMSIFLCLGCGSPIANQKGSEDIKTPSRVSDQEAFKNSVTDCPENFPYEFSSEGFCVRVEWFDFEDASIDWPIYYQDYNLVWKRPVHAKIYFMDKTTLKPIEPTEESDANIFAVKLWMPTHGHGSQKPSVKKIDRRLGEYLVEDLYFIMKSDSENPWQLRLLLKTQDNDEAYNEAEDRDVVDSVIIPFYKLDIR